MLATVYTKSLRDRWVGTAASMAVIALFLTLAMAAYQEIGTDLYQQMPEAMRSVMGIPAGADAAALAYAVIFGMLAALTLAGLAVSMGASSVAGEERDGSIAVLLANPRSRRQVLGSKAAGMVTLAALGAALLIGGGYLAPVVLGVEIGSSHITAVGVHLFANALLWGSMAMMLGAVTGNRSLASAASAGLMVASYFMVGLLPLSASTAGLAKALPWFWFDGHDPLSNGIHGGYLALQSGLVVVLAAVAWWGVEARDLTRPTGGRSLVASVTDRLREDPRAARVIERLSGGARVGSIWVRTASEGRPLLIVVALVMFSLMGLMMGPMYAALADTLAEVSTSLPEAMLAFVGGGDMSSPEGWYRLESFGLMAPIALIVVSAAVGARALAGEEQDRTMGLLLASPVRRRTVVLQKAVAMALHATIVGFATFAGVAGGSLIAGLGMSIPNIAAASLLATLLGLMFGMLSLAVSAATGSVRTATMATIATAGTAYLANSVLSIGGSLERWAVVSPFEWYLGGDPLLRGVEWSSVGLFVGVTAVLLVAAVMLFDRRDLRRS